MFRASSLPAGFLEAFGSEALAIEAVYTLLSLEHKLTETAVLLPTNYSAPCPSKRWCALARQEKCFPGKLEISGSTRFSPRLRIRGIMESGCVAVGEPPYMMSANF